MNRKHSSIIRVIICIVAGLITGGVIMGIIIVNNPTYYSNIMMRLGKYASVAAYYNKLDSEKKTEIKDSLIFKIEDTYKEWEKYNIAYDQAKSVMVPFQAIDDEDIKTITDAHLSFMLIESTGDEALEKAETYLGDEDYIQVMKCLKGVDESYSSYKSLQGMYDVSKKVLLDYLGNPVTVDEYTEAIKTLDGYISEIDDEDFIKKKGELEQELAIVSCTN